MHKAPGQATRMMRDGRIRVTGNWVWCLVLNIGCWVWGIRYLFSRGKTHHESQSRIPGNQSPEPHPASRIPHPVLFLLLMIFVPSWCCADSAALIVGIGVIRSKTDDIGGEAGWTSRACPRARGDAEEAFREMISSARGERHLYSYPIRWNGARRDRINTAVFLTDGVTDNRSIPVETRIQVEQRNLVRGVTGSDDFILYAAGIGGSDGSDSWIYDRIGNTIFISRLLDAFPSPAENARRICIVRIYGDEPDPTAHMLFFADSRSITKFLSWLNEAKDSAMNAKNPNRTESFAPGLSGLLANITPARLQRAILRFKPQSSPFGSLMLINFGNSLERLQQRVEIPIVSQISPVYKKERRAGPLFTIIEDETDIKVGEETIVDYDALRVELAKQKLSQTVTSRIETRIRKKVAHSFKEEFTVAKISYQLEYQRTERRILLSYLD